MFSINIQHLKKTIGSDYELCMKIYRESFPSAERQQESVIADRINSGVATLYVAYHEAEPVGFAILFHLKNCRFTLLDYFAVDSSVRAGGIGSVLLRNVFDEFLAIQDQGSTNESDPTYLVMEVEDVGYGDNTDQRKKRIRFYQKAGAVVLESIKYLLPPLGDATSPTEMKLMLYPAPKKEFTNATTNTLITELYRQVYNRSDDDPLLRSLLTNSKESSDNLN